MKLKVLAVLLSMAMLTLSLAGCSDEREEVASNGSNAQSVSEQKEKQEPDNNSEEIVELIWHYPTAGEFGPGFKAVENALNEMLEKDIGVHVTFEPCNLSESHHDAALAISSGEQIDIVSSAYNVIGDAVEDGIIIPLDDLLQTDGIGIVNTVNPGAIAATGYGGKVYGVPSGGPVYNGFGYIIRKDMCDKYDITIDPDKLYTMDELEDIFAIVKAGEGEGFYCMVSQFNSDVPFKGAYIELDAVGGSTAAGVLMLNRSFEDLTVYNLYETEEYKDYVYTMYDWANKGYIAPDAAIATETVEELLKTGNYLGHCFWTRPDTIANIEGATGYEYEVIKMIDNYIPYNCETYCSWNISTSCEYPEKAMQALNYLYENKEAAWLVQFGIEGESYEVVEQTEAGTKIRYLADISSLPYYQNYGLWGFDLDWPTVEPGEMGISEEIKTVQEALPENRYSPAIGYSFNASNVSAEKAAVTTVIDQYMPSINAGALNPDDAYPEFLDALKDAGIDKVIAENQKQLEEWALNNK